MAITVASLEAVLDLSKDKFDKGLKSAGSGLKNIAGIGAKALGAGIVAGAAVGVSALAGIGATAFNVASDLDKAQAEIAASLGISKDAAGQFNDEIKDIFTSGAGENFSQIGEAIATVKKSIDGIDDASLKAVAQGALVLDDAFGKDVNETVDATAVLMEEMGLSGKQALDFITKGLQSGLDRNGDFLDSIREYGNLFGDAGFDAGQFFSVLESGAAGGVLGTDKIADAVKEFAIRANEGGAAFKDAFSGIGLDFDAIAAEVSSGQSTWADYFSQVVGGLQGVDNSLARSQLQTALFGTQAEDLGASFTEGLSDATTTIEDMAGATDKLNQRYDTLGDALEGVKRRAMVALEPLGSGMLDALNNVMPQVTAFFGNVLGPAIARFGAGAGPIFEDFVNKLTNTVGPAMDLINDALKRIDIAFGGTGESVDGVNVLLGVLGGILDAVIFGIQATAIAFQGVAWAIEQVTAGVKTVGGWLDSLGDKLSGLGDLIPDWLKPGSPPPLAVGLGAIADELKAMPDMAGSLGFGGGAMTANIPASLSERGTAPGGLGQGRGGGVTVIVQGSINGDAHLQQTVMDAFNQLNQALAGATS